MENVNMILGIISSIVTIIGIPIIGKQLSDLLPPKLLKIRYIRRDIIDNQKKLITKDVIVADNINKLINRLINNNEEITNIKIIYKFYQKYKNNKINFDAIILKATVNHIRKPIIIRGLKLIFDEDILAYYWEAYYEENLKEFVLDYFDLVANFPTDVSTLDFYFYNNDRTFFLEVKIELDEETENKLKDKINYQNQFGFYIPDASDFFKIAPNYKKKIILRSILYCASSDEYWDDDNNFKFKKDIIYIFRPDVWEVGLS